MKKVRILQEAAEEAIAAADWYDKEREGLGKEFAVAVEIAIDLIEEDILPLSPTPCVRLFVCLFLGQSRYYLGLRSGIYQACNSPNSLLGQLKQISHHYCI